MNTKKKYTVYENDLRFKTDRNINPDMADWDNDNVKNNFNKNLDTLESRLEITEKENFSYLDLSRLELTQIPNFNDYKNYDKLINIKYLFLNDNKLINCDNALQYFKNLEVLDISFNCIELITFLPTKLKEFICHNNKIVKIPSHENIKVLDCSNNKIKKLGEYPNVRDLICCDNNLTSIKQYNMLKTMTCKNNPIINFSIQPNLELLDCSNTKLTGKLNGLFKLNGLICNFTTISDITDLEKLESLEIEGCRMNIPYLEHIKCILFSDDDDIKLSENLKIKNVIKNGNSICLIFV
jgi:hypothetical protein